MTPRHTNTAAAHAVALEEDHVASARGLISAAIDLLPSTADATLLACDAWTDLDEPGVLPTLLPHEPHAADVPSDLLLRARTALTTAITVSGSPARMLACATAVRTLDAALAMLGLDCGSPGATTPD